MAEPLLEEYIPTARTQDMMQFDDGTVEKRCYQLDSPVYYRTSDDTLHKIEVDQVENKVSAIGDILLREKNVASVGLRTDGEVFKYLGIRPDNTQDLGTQQLEFSLEDFILDGVEHTPVLTTPTIINNNIVDLGSTITISNNVHNRQAVKLSNNTDCQVKYQLHLTGMKISNEKGIGSHVVRESLPAPIFTDVGEITGAEGDVWDQYLTGVLADDSTFTIGICRRDGSLISIGTDGDLNDPVLESYNAVEPLAQTCVSIIEDGIFHFHFQNPPTGINLNRLLRDTIESLTDGTITDDGTHIRINGKAVCGYLSKNNWFAGVITCKDLADQFSAVFNTDDFWSPTNIDYVDVEYSVLKDVFVINIVDRFNIDTEVSVENAYVPDELGRFIITDMEDNFLFSINQPVAIDSEYNAISEITTAHTLYEVDGKYEYLKMPDSKTVVSKLLEDASYFDASVHYATSSSNNVGTGEVAAWATARAMTSGTLLGTGNMFGVASSYLKNYGVGRVHAFFNTSGIPDANNITAAVFYFYIDNVNSFSMQVDANNRVMLFRSLNAGTSVALGHFNLAYFSTYLGQSATLVANTSGWKSVTLSNLSYISKTGYTKIAMRHYRDYYNQAPTGINAITFNKSPAAGPAYLSVTSVASNRTVTFNTNNASLGTVSGSTSQSVPVGGNASAVTAVPTASGEFVGWTGSITSSSNPLTVTNVQSNMTITANFVLKTRDVIFSSANSELGSISGVANQSVNYGSNATAVKAVPKGSCFFTGWTGSVVSTDNPITLTNVTDDKTLVANFKRLKMLIST